MNLRAIFAAAARVCPFCGDPRPRYWIACGLWCIACNRTEPAHVDEDGKPTTARAGLPLELMAELWRLRGASAPRASGMSSTLSGVMDEDVYSGSS